MYKKITIIENSDLKDLLSNQTIVLLDAFHIQSMENIWNY